MEKNMERYVFCVFSIVACVGCLILGRYFFATLFAAIAVGFFGQARGWPYIIKEHGEAGERSINAVEAMRVLTVALALDNAAAESDGRNGARATVLREARDIALGTLDLTLDDLAAFRKLSAAYPNPTT